MRNIPSYLLNLPLGKNTPKTAKYVENLTKMFIRRCEEAFVCYGQPQKVENQNTEN